MACGFQGGKNTVTVPVDLRLVFGVSEIVRVPVSPINSELGLTEAAAIAVGYRFESTAEVDVARVTPALEARVNEMPGIGRVDGGLMKFDTLI